MSTPRIKSELYCLTDTARDSENTAKCLWDVGSVPDKQEAACVGGPAVQNPRSVTTILGAYLTTLLNPEESSTVPGEGHIPFSSPLKFRKSCVVAFIHLSAVLLFSLGRKARWTLERFASAAAPAEGCLFIIVRLQTDAA